MVWFDNSSIKFLKQIEDHHRRQYVQIKTADVIEKQTWFLISKEELESSKPKPLDISRKRSRRRRLRGICWVIFKFRSLSQQQPHHYINILGSWNISVIWWSYKSDHRSFWLVVVEIPLRCPLVVAQFPTWFFVCLLLLGGNDRSTEEYKRERKTHTSKEHTDRPREHRHTDRPREHRHTRTRIKEQTEQLKLNKG